MSEGKWVEAKFGDIREGDVVRVTTKNGPQTIITEGAVTRYMPDGARAGEALWSIEDFENYFEHEFEPDEDGEFATLERFVPAFVWPTKLGAVVTGKDEDGEYTAVLVEVNPRNPDHNSWWVQEWGTVETEDLYSMEDLTVISEGVTVGS